MYRTRTVEHENIKGFSIVKGFNHLFGLGPIKKTYFVGPYDYYEIGVKYGNDLSIPRNFGGMSGGGLWQVRLIKQADGTIQIKSHFYQELLFTKQTSLTI